MRQFVSGLKFHVSLRGIAHDFARAISNGSERMAQQIASADSLRPHSDTKLTGYRPGEKQFLELTPSEVQRALERAFFGLNLLLQLENRIQYGLRPRGATGHIHIDRDHLIASLNDGVIVEHARRKWRKLPWK